MYFKSGRSALFGFGSGNRIDSAFVPWMAAADSLGAEPESPGRTMELHGFASVFGATRVEAALREQDAAGEQLIANDQPVDDVSDHGLRGFPLFGVLVRNFAARPFHKATVSR